MLGFELGKGYAFSFIHSIFLLICASVGFDTLITVKFNILNYVLVLKTLNWIKQILVDYKPLAIMSLSHQETLEHYYNYT